MKIVGYVVVRSDTGQQASPDYGFSRIGKMGHVYTVKSIAERKAKHVKYFTPPPGCQLLVKEVVYDDGEEGDARLAKLRLNNQITAKLYKKLMEKK